MPRALALWPKALDLCATATDTAPVLAGKAMYCAIPSRILERAIKYPSCCKADESGFGEAATLMLVDKCRRASIGNIPRGLIWNLPNMRGKKNRCSALENYHVLS